MAAKLRLPLPCNPLIYLIRRSGGMNRVRLQLFMLQVVFFPFHLSSFNSWGKNCVNTLIEFSFLDVDYLRRFWWKKSDEKEKEWTDTKELHTVWRSMLSSFCFFSLLRHVFIIVFRSFAFEINFKAIIEHRFFSQLTHIRPSQRGDNESKIGALAFFFLFYFDRPKVVESFRNRFLFITFICCPSFIALPVAGCFSAENFLQQLQCFCSPHPFKSRNDFAEATYAVTICDMADKHTAAVKQPLELNESSIFFRSFFCRILFAYAWFFHWLL